MFLGVLVTELGLILKVTRSIGQATFLKKEALHSHITPMAALGSHL
jgi:hypothetical protein